MATYAVGDIQGCLPDLKALLKHVNFGSSDTLWCAGDLVNRGPESLKTLRYVKALGERAQIVLGNHDLHLLACWLGFRKPNRKDTFDEILRAKDADELMYWLLQQPLLHHDAKLGYTMVHAGIPPQWSLKKAQGLAAEVEHMLQSKHAYKFFAHMYGNNPAGWSDDLTGTTRLRTITNYFTRMRFCSDDGSLEFDSKCNPDSPPKGFKPWYTYSQHKCRKRHIIFGHWAAMMGNTGVGNFIGLDTGCVWGGQLTMLRLDDGKLFSIDCDDCGI